MTKHTDSSRSTDSDSSAPNSPELTRLSGEQAGERTAREGRLRERAKVLERVVAGKKEKPMLERVDEHEEGDVYG